MSFLTFQKSDVDDPPPPFVSNPVLFFLHFLFGEETIGEIGKDKKNTIIIT